MTTLGRSLMRGQTQIRCGREVFVFRYDLDLESLNTLGCAVAALAAEGRFGFGLLAAYRVMRNVDEIVAAADKVKP